MTEADLAVSPVDGERQLSPLDAACLFLERPNQPLHLGCIVELEGAIGLDDLLEILSARLLPLRRFRQRPVRTPLDLAAPVWEDDLAFELREHVRHVALPAPGGELELQHVVETLFSAPLAPDRPLWEIHLIDNLTGGRSALLCKLHHCMSDGLGALQVLERIADASHALRRPERDAYGDDAHPPLPPDDAVAEPGGESVLSALAAALAPASLLARVRELGEAAAVVESLLEERDLEMPFSGPLGHRRRMVWRSFPFDEFVSLRAAADCTINDAVLAVLAGCLRRHLEERALDPDGIALRAAVPVSVRGGDGAPGNAFTAVFPRLPVDVPDPIERLRRARDEMRDLKRRGQARATGAMLALFGRLPWAAEAALLRLAPDRRLFDTVCTNMIGPQKPLRLLGRRITALHPIVPLFQRVGLGFAVASYAGHISICASTDPALVPEPESLLRGIDDALYETRSALWARSDALAIAAGLARHAEIEGRARARTLVVPANEPSLHWTVDPTGPLPALPRRES